VIASFGLAACGFEPLYGERGSEPATEEVLAYVQVPPIADRVGQLVRIELMNRMTPANPLKPLYVLEVGLSEGQKSLAVRRDASTTRANLILSASFSLKRADDGAKIMGGSARSVNGYDVLTSDFATFAAETDARKRGAKDIADRIVERVSIFLSRPANRVVSTPQR